MELVLGEVIRIRTQFLEVNPEAIFLNGKEEFITKGGSTFYVTQVKNNICLVLRCSQWIIKIDFILKPTFLIHCGPICS